MAHRTTFSILLTCSLLTMLITPRVVSQNVVTSTEVSVTSLTSTMYSTVQTSSLLSQPVHYNLTPSDYDSRTGTFKLSFTESTNTGFIGDFEDYPCLFYDYFLLNATSGHTIHSHFQLSMVGRAITFLILNPQQFWGFEHSNCGWGLASSMLHVYAPSSDFDWVVPASGQYALIFATSVFYSGQVYYSAQDYYSVVQSQTSTSTFTSVFGVPYVALSTPATTQPISSSLGSENEAFSWIPIILILGVGLGIALVLRRRR